MSRRWIAFVAALSLFVLLPGAAWLLRHPIATHFVDRELARRGVEAHYRIAGIGFGRQVLEDVVIGPVSAPDLTARRVVVRTAVGLSGVGLTGLDAEGVRLRGRWQGGRLRLGQVDRLMPLQSGGAFRLPDLPLKLMDVGVDLLTAAGRVRFAVAGAGNLASTFDGRVALNAARLAASGCTASGVRADFGATVRAGAPTLSGPLLAGALDCPRRLGASELRLRPVVRIASTFDRLTADLPLAVRRVAIGDVGVEGVGGRLRVGLDRRGGSADGTLTASRIQAPRARAIGVTAQLQATGSLERIVGRVRLASANVSSFDGSARDVLIEGRTTVTLAGSTRVQMKGRASAARLNLPSTVVAFVPRLRATGAPLDALALKFANAARAATTSMSASGAYQLSVGGDRPALKVTSLQLRSASGARLTLSGGSGLVVPLEGRAWPTVDGLVRVAGGDLPTGTLQVRSDAAGALSGVARLEPYGVADSRLAFAPVRFTRQAAGATRIRTLVEVTGSFAGGRIEGASLPIDALVNRSGELTINSRCTPLRFRSLAIRGLTLDPAQLQLCPNGRAGLFSRAEDGTTAIEARLIQPRLTGRIGATPLTISADDGDVRASDGRFIVRSLNVSVGRAAATTRLQLTQVSGAVRGSGFSGTFAGAAGQVGAVPVLWSDGAGDWALENGRLAVTGALTVADVDRPARFQTLSASDLQLSLAGSKIAGTGSLVDPRTGRVVTSVTIRHNFAAGAGEARFAVSGLTFDERLQPSRLTPLALGVVAEVRGRVSGDARIAWGGPDVVSTGTFTTTGMDLAAAFGPVKGLSTSVRFTDLLNLVTADGQTLTVESVNPGTEVRDGVVRYAIVSGRRIAVRSGRWPFGGGVLDLEPTVLDFGEGASQRFTLDVAGLDASVLLHDFGFENISATGVFDGRFPLIFTDGNGRVTGGELRSRPPGGTVAYVGSVSQEDLGFFGNLAFDALRALRYEQLAVTLNGPLSGSLITGLQFDGLAQGAGAKRNLLARAIAGLPFVFKIRIDAPLRQLLGSARSFSDPSLLVEQNLGLLYREQIDRTGIDPFVPRQHDQSIQDQESEPRP